MFNMSLWDSYLGEYCQNAMNNGANTLDVIDLLLLRILRLMPKARAELIMKEMLLKNKEDQPT